MDGNSIAPITKYATGKKSNIDEVFRKTKIIDLDEKSGAMELFGLEKKL